MIGLNPYLRYINSTSYLPNKNFVKAYDCRFLFVLSGEGELLTEKESFSLSENTLAYYPCRLAYFLKTSAEKPMSFITVNFDFTRSCPAHDKTLSPVKPENYSTDIERPTQIEIGEKLFLDAFTVKSASLRDDFVKLDLLFKEDGNLTREISSTFLKYIILKVLNQFPNASNESSVVQKIVDYIESHYNENLSNHIIADKFGYHPYYLSSLLKNQTGKTLHQYVLDTRLKTAADMLLHTDMSICEISDACGFQNPNHFSVKFKAKYEESPISWKTHNSIV